MPIDKTIIDFEIILKKIHYSLTAEEEILLSKWLNESAVHQQYFEDAVRYHRNGSSFSKKDAGAKKAWRALKNRGLDSSRSKTRWIVSLSAAIIGIFFVLNYLLPSKIVNTTQISSVKTEIIPPGTNQAKLILDNGTVYELTASKNLELTEGGADIKSEGTKIEYTEVNSIPQEVKYNTLSIPRGGEFFLQLSDGTKVWINSETVLRYPVQFVGNDRRVELTGEAFFEVAPNEKVPFFVESGNQVIKVLGTEFNISSYKEDALIYTTLVNGSVEVSVKDMPKMKLSLIPNEQSALNIAEVMISKHEVNPYQYVAWKDGRFVFENERLGEIMKKLSKWYNVDVVFANENLQNIRFTGNLQRYSDFGDILSKIMKTNEVKFNIENRQITIL